MKTSRLILILVAAVVVLIVLAMMLGGSGESVLNVTASEVGRKTIVETVEASGKIYPETELKLSPDVSGEITQILVEEGDSVKKGQLVVKLKPDIYESQVTRAEAALNQAKANLANAKARELQARAQFNNSKKSYERNLKLREQKVISEAEFETIEAQYRTAEAELEAARQTVKGAEFSVKSGEATVNEANDNLEFTSIYAPMDGVVSLVLKESGERVQGVMQFQAEEILRIADFSSIEVQVDVSENDILRVSMNDTAIIEVDAYPDRKFKGVVNYIANSATPAGLAEAIEGVTNFVVKIRLVESSYSDLVDGNNFPFKPGMSAAVDILTEKVDQGISVPIQAVTIREMEDTTENQTMTLEELTQEVVFLVEGDKVRQQVVKSGIQDDRFINIKEGLQDGETVVSGPYRTVSKELEDGDLVKVISKKTASKKESKQ